MNPFTNHPASVGESYPAHLHVATRFGVRMIAGGMAKSSPNATTWCSKDRWNSSSDVKRA